MLKQFFKKNRNLIILGLILSLVFLLSYLIDWNLGGILSSRESLKSFIESFGALGPVVLIFIVYLEVIFAPIPGFIPALTAGFIFGPIWGAIYLYIGNILGTITVFLFVREFGQSLAHRLFSAKKMKKYDKILARHENFLLALYFIPIFPLDVITAVIALSAIKTKKFLIAILFGFLVYSFVLAFFGDSIANVYFRLF